MINTIPTNSNSCYKNSFTAEIDMVRTVRQFGGAKEIGNNIDPRFISFRLDDGTFIGPSLISVDKKYQIAPGEEKNILEYSEELVNKLQTKGWNIRSHEYEIPEFAETIYTHNQLNNHPLLLVLDGSRLVVVDGHRRVLSTMYIAQKYDVLLKVCGDIEKYGTQGHNWRYYENLQLTTDKRLNFTILDELKYFTRRQKEDYQKGLSESEFLNDLEMLGYKSSVVKATLQLGAYSRDILELLKSKMIAKTTLVDLLKMKQLTQAEKESTIKQLYQQRLVENNFKSIKGVEVEAAAVAIIENKEKHYKEVLATDTQVNLSQVKEENNFYLESESDNLVANEINEANAKDVTNGSENGNTTRYSSISNTKTADSEIKVTTSSVPTVDITKLNLTPKPKASEFKKASLELIHHARVVLHKDLDTLISDGIEQDRVLVVCDKELYHKWESICDRS